MNDIAIRAERLRKRYRRAAADALAGVDLTVGRGSVCGVLGPNGAGKTTAVRILATLLRCDDGRAEVAGHDVTREPARVRAAIGLVGQHTAVDDALSGRENLAMFARLNHLGGDRGRVAGLLERFGLAEAADRPARQYSGGMRRRLDLAVGVLAAPRVLFLDEPTAGLDPRGRDAIWRLVRELAADGTTVLLTTQYLDEADRLADQIAVIDRGRVIADGTPAALKSRIGGDRLDVVVRDPADQPAAAALVARAAGAEAVRDEDGHRVSAPVRDRVAALTEAARALDAAGIAVDDLAVRRPSLDEVFLRLTGPAEVAA